jgi:hypothetical protein
MDGTGNNPIKRNKPDSERQVSHVFLIMESRKKKRHEGIMGTIKKKEGYGG